jgi:DNA-directed RNA polymerase specialized sigma24 family protein
MSTAHLVSGWIEQWKQGDDEAARKLWERFFSRLVEVAVARLGAGSKRRGDEEAIAAAAFNSFFERARSGQFQAVNDRNSLWALLLTIVERKAINHQIAETRSFRSNDPRRQGGDVVTLLAGSDPTPDFEVMVADEFEHLLGMLGQESLVRVVVLRLQGYSVREISEEMGVELRTVYRKLDTIRQAWSGRLGA